VAALLSGRFFRSTPVQAQVKLSFSIATGGNRGSLVPPGRSHRRHRGKESRNTEATAEATRPRSITDETPHGRKSGNGFLFDYHVVWANEGKVPGLTGKHNGAWSWFLRASPFTLPQRGVRRKSILSLYSVSCILSPLFSFFQSPVSEFSLPVPR